MQQFFKKLISQHTFFLVELQLCTGQQCIMQCLRAQSQNLNPESVPLKTVLHCVSSSTYMLMEFSAFNHLQMGTRIVLLSVFYFSDGVNI